MFLPKTFFCASFSPVLSYNRYASGPPLDCIARCRRMRTNGGDQSSYRIQLLGEFAVRLRDRTVIDRSWHRRKAQGLIKLLALQKGGRLHREQVVDLLWPRLAPDDAANNLYK